MTLEEYNSIGDKTANGRPTRLCYIKEYPNGKILFNYEPNTAETLYLDSVKVANNFALISTTMSMTGEYEEALIFNLAMRLAPDFDWVLDPLVIAIAEKSKNTIMKQNLKPIPQATFEAALLYNSSRGGYNIYTGE